MQVKLPFANAGLIRGVATALLSLVAAEASHATLVSITPSSYGVWNTFDVAPDLAASFGSEWIDINDGSAMSYSFTIASGYVGKLTIVDAGFSGDRFSVLANGTALGTTGAAVQSYPTSIGLDFDAALANSDYSRGLFTLASGTYTVTGSLLTSALDNLGAPIGSTVGGMKLDVSAVPLPAAALLLLNGLGLFGFAARRRAAR